MKNNIEFITLQKLNTGDTLKPLWDIREPTGKLSMDVIRLDSGHKYKSAKEYSLVKLGFASRGNGFWVNSISVCFCLHNGILKCLKIPAGLMQKIHGMDIKDDAWVFKIHKHMEIMGGAQFPSLKNTEVIEIPAVPFDNSVFAQIPRLDEVVNIPSLYDHIPQIRAKLNTEDIVLFDEILKKIREKHPSIFRQKKILDFLNSQ
jgi:hypothetical protein